MPHVSMSILDVDANQHCGQNWKQFPLFYYLLLLQLLHFQNNLGKLKPEKQNHFGKTNLNLLEQEIVSGSGISRAICKSEPRSRQITMPAPHRNSLSDKFITLPRLMNAWSWWQGIRFVTDKPLIKFSSKLLQATVCKLLLHRVTAEANINKIISYVIAQQWNNDISLMAIFSKSQCISSRALTSLRRYSIICMTSVSEPNSCRNTGSSPENHTMCSVQSKDINYILYSEFSKNMVQLVVQEVSGCAWYEDNGPHLAGIL